jgi:hypothetical protein
MVATDHLDEKKVLLSALQRKAMAALLASLFVQGLILRQLVFMRTMIMKQ